MLKKRIIAALKKVLVESDFKSIEKKFLNQGIEKEEVKKTLEVFKELRDKHRIRNLEEKNIDFWGNKDFDELKNFVSTLLKTSSKTSIRKDTHKKHVVDGAEFITENSDWLVYKINDYNASDLLGSRDWCIVRDKDDFESHSTKMTFYYILSKNRDKEDAWYKIALSIDSKGRKLYWDNYDQPPSGSSTIPLKELKIPEFKATFEFVIIVNGKKFTEKEFIATKGLKVDGYLYLRDTPITKLPEGLKVGGFLDLSSTQITELPEGLKVGGFLDLSDTEITKLPEGLTVGGNLILMGTQISELPEKLKVGKDLYLWGTKITVLPEGLEVGCAIDVTDKRKIECSEALREKLRSTPFN